MPLGRPVVVFGDGLGSYCRDRSQYCPSCQVMPTVLNIKRGRGVCRGKENVRKVPSHLSGQSPWIVHDSLGRIDPSSSRPVY